MFVPQTTMRCPVVNGGWTITEADAPGANSWQAGFWPRVVVGTPSLRPNGLLLPVASAQWKRDKETAWPG